MTELLEISRPTELSFFELYNHLKPNYIIPILFANR